jgi:excisionase family DNA binding protein
MPKDQNEQIKFLSLKELADLLGISEPTVRRLVDSRAIPFCKFGGLEDHLREINSGLEVEKHTTDIKSWLLSGADWTDNADLVIDCSASNHVHAAFEKAKMNEKDKRVPVVSMVIDGRATHGLAISIGKDYSGGIQDAYRKALIMVCKEPSLSPYADGFYPDPKKRKKLFQPEPGCSDPTFVGSAADSLALSSLMLNASTEVFSLNDESVSARFVIQFNKKQDPCVRRCALQNKSRIRNDLFFIHKIRCFTKESTADLDPIVFQKDLNYFQKFM